MCQLFLHFVQCTITSEAQQFSSLPQYDLSHYVGVALVLCIFDTLPKIHHLFVLFPTKIYKRNYVLHSLLLI